MKSRIFLSFIFIATVLSCQGPIGIPGPDGKNGDTEKQIRLTFNPNGYSGADSLTYWLNTSMDIIKFNKDYYENIDSICFYCDLRATRPSDTVSIKLMNITDSTFIESSRMQSTDTGYVERFSPNILKFFPSKEITLGIFIKGSGYFFEPTLFLYRK